MDAHKILATLAGRLARRIAEVDALLRIDQAIHADPYDNVARMKELQRVRRWITELQATGPSAKQERPRPPGLDAALQYRPHPRSPHCPQDLR